MCREEKKNPHNQVLWVNNPQNDERTSGKQCKQTKERTQEPNNKPTKQRNNELTNEQSNQRTNDELTNISIREWDTGIFCLVWSGHMRR